MEEILKSLPWKAYMTNLKHLYSKYQKNSKQPYIFEDGKMRKWEDLTRLRDKRLKDFEAVRKDSRKPCWLFKINLFSNHFDCLVNADLDLHPNWMSRIINGS